MTGCLCLYSRCCLLISRGSRNDHSTVHLFCSVAAFGSSIIVNLQPLIHNEMPSKQTLCPIVLCCQWRLFYLLLIVLWTKFWVFSKAGQKHEHVSHQLVSRDSGGSPAHFFFFFTGNFFGSKVSYRSQATRTGDLRRRTAVTEVQHCLVVTGSFGWIFLHHLSIFGECRYEADVHALDWIKINCQNWFSCHWKIRIHLAPFFRHSREWWSDLCVRMGSDSLDLFEEMEAEWVLLFTLMRLE